MVSKHILVSFLALTLLSACAGTRNSAQIGMVQLEDEFAWAPVEEQIAVGWVTQRAMQDSGLGYEIGAQFAWDTALIPVGSDMVGVASRNIEVWGGGRFELVVDNVRPYLSGGLSILQAEAEFVLNNLSMTDNDTSFGFYLGAGIDLDISETVFFGVGVRQTFHEVELFGSIPGGGEFDADFTQFFVRIGTTF